MEIMPAIEGGKVTRNNFLPFARPLLMDFKMPCMDWLSCNESCRKFDFRSRIVIRPVDWPGQLHHHDRDCMEYNVQMRGRKP